MKFSAVLLFVIGAVAVPQNAATTSAPTSAAPAPTGLTPAVSCAMACNAGDVNCQAACLGNARPNASQAIETNECAAKCDQGDGSTAASQKYAKCVDSCINSLFPSSQTAFNGAPAGAGAAPASSAADSSAAATGSSSPSGTHAGTSSRPTGSSSVSGSSSAPKATGAAGKASAGIAGAGLAGLLAVFAL
ncbi:anchored cell wall 4 [Pyrenophora seminiperda CCB06]|uniref:Anchored cell wall 4 n=1 Tax=Pyrenophora seminiperda CCB06 TaxID=1302712 RepID=A0A3M7LWR0_9PLEO|nr:anchored cell wall 4 [Pyrenophora seminiperda CCB06]